MNNSSDPEGILPSREILAGMMDNSDVNLEQLSVLERKKGPCVYYIYPREMDIIKRYLAWAEKVDRICVIEPDCAYLVYKFCNIKPNMITLDADGVPIADFDSACMNLMRVINMTRFNYVPFFC